MKKQKIHSGIRDSIPLALAIASYGIPYGVLASQAGFGIMGSVAMSLLVFSGSVQMIAVAMFSTGASILSILSTAVLLNLRNILYGAALSKGISASKKLKYLLAYGVSDEPFVLGMARFNKYGPDPGYFCIITLVFYTVWFSSSTIGALAGKHIIEPSTLGLDLAFPITFIAILIPLLNKKPVIYTAICGSIITILCELIWPGTPLSIILAGTISPLIGCYIHSLENKKEVYKSC